MMTMGALKLVAAAVIGTMVLSGLTLVLARGSASPSLAATAAPSPDRPATAPTTGQTRLPPDLETIVAGWEANAERIRSLSLHGTIRVDSKEYAAATDLEGKSYPGHSGQFMMVRDGDTIRIDTHFDRMFDVASGKVRYQQPYGRLDPRAPTTQMTPATATTSDTMRVLVNGNELTRYWVEANLVLIVPRRTELSQLPERELPQLLYSSPLGETPFRRYIETRQRTGAITVEQAKDGSKVIHWRGRATIADPDRATREMAIILNPNKGYAIESIRPTEGGHPVGEMSYEYVQHNGVWLLVGIKTREWGADGKTLARSAEANVDPTSIKANEPVAPTFSVEALGIADDAHVQDSIRQKAYTYRQMSE